MKRTTVVVGANLAGGRAVAALRTQGYEGDIILIGAESHRPYQRPPLSKDVLWDATRTLEKLSLHPEAFYADNRIQLRLNTRVTRLDLASGRVQTDVAGEVRADDIILATGGRPRRLGIEGEDLDGVLALRAHADAVDLRARLQPGAKFVIVGMGVIGAEVASSAVKLGCDVTVVEAAPLPMTRIFGSTLSRWLCDKHERMGVRVLLNTGVARFIGDGGRVRAVETSTGERLEADVVLVAVGIHGATELAAEAGITVVPAGVVVDRQGRTSAPHVYAAGDVTAQPCFFSKQPIRVETFQNASEQALAAAAGVAGKAVEYCRPVWFWTDQYDLKIQAVGRVDDRLRAVVRGEPASEKFATFFFNGDVVEGMVTINCNPDMAVGRRLVEQQARPDPAKLADASIPLKTLLPATPPAGG